MTCRERLKIEHPEYVNERYPGGCKGCPHEYRYLDRPEYCIIASGVDNERCTKCWDREIPGTEETKEKDMHYADYNYLKTKSYEELIDIAIEDDLRIRDRDERIAVMEKQIEDLDSNNKIHLRALESKNVWIGTLEGKLKDKDEEIDRLIKNAVNKEEKIENLKDIIESKNGLIGTLKQKVSNAERDERITKKVNKDLVHIVDIKEARIIELGKKIESLEKDVTFYRNEIDKRNQRLDEKEAKILNMQDTIDFQERHINRIEGELKLYKGMKVDTNKTDYNKLGIKHKSGRYPWNSFVKPDELIGIYEDVKFDEDGTHITLLLTGDVDTYFGNNVGISKLGEKLTVGDFVEHCKLRTMPDIDELSKYKGETGDKPICSTVPASAVIGKIHSLNSMATDEEPNLTFKLHKDAVKKITGKDSWSDIDYLIMPNEEYESEINRRINQCIYYSKLLPKYLSATSSEKAPVGIVNSIKIKSQASKYYAKYESLKSAGFTEDQAMQLLPIWTIDEEE